MMFNSEPVLPGSMRATKTEPAQVAEGMFSKSAAGSSPREPRRESVDVKRPQDIKGIISASDPRHTRVMVETALTGDIAATEGGSFSADYELIGSVMDSTQQHRVETAVHKRTGRSVIVKSFNLDRLSRRDANDLQGEIATQSAVNHPNIAKLQAVYKNRKRVRMVIEHLEGGDLFDHLAYRGTFSESETVSVVKQLLEAVAHLHDNGIVHRDIKLENIVYETADHDKVKLIDFGYSTFWEAGQQPMRRTCGTMTYLAPEVLKEAYTNKADLWCVGVAAHAMLTGQVLARRRDGSAVFSAEFGRCSPAAQDFVTKLLRSDPRRRMSASEALRHRWLQEMTSEEAQKLGKSGWGRSLSVTPGRKSPLTGFADFGRRKISAWWTAARQAKVAFGLRPEMRVMPSQSA